MCRPIMLLSKIYQIWCIYPFSQRNKKAKRAGGRVRQNLKKEGRQYRGGGLNKIGRLGTLCQLCSRHLGACSIFFFFYMQLYIQQTCGKEWILNIFCEENIRPLLFVCSVSSMDILNWKQI